MSKKRPRSAFISCVLGILSLLVLSLPILPQILQASAAFLGWSAYNVTEINPEQYKNSWAGWAGFFMGMIGLGIWLLSTLVAGFNTLINH